MKRKAIQPGPCDIANTVARDAIERSKVGVRKYGVPLSGNYSILSERFQHAYEEQLDGANYLEWARRGAVELESRLDELESFLYRTSEMARSGMSDSLFRSETKKDIRKLLK
jgi:hypothetical protein